MYPNLVVLSQVTDDLSKYPFNTIFNAPKGRHIVIALSIGMSLLSVHSHHVWSIYPI